VAGLVLGLGLLSLLIVLPSHSIMLPATTQQAIQFESLVAPEDQNPAPQTVSIQNIGGETLDWIATKDTAWLHIAPTSGTAPSTLQVSADGTGLPVGNYTGTITITATSPHAQNAVQTVLVTFDVNLKSDIELTKKATDGARNEITRAHVGDTIVYVFEVENTGNVDLTLVTLTDDTGICDAAPKRGNDKIGDNDDTLEPGEVWVYTCNHLVTADDPDPLVNTATASGTDPLQQEVTDRDDAQVDILKPGIELTKKATDGAGNEITQAHVGDTIVYVFEVENTGNTDLTLVTLTDDTGICDAAPKRGNDKIGDNDDILEPGEVWVYTCNHLVTDDDPNPLVNTATASGTDPLQQEVTDDARVTVVVIPPPKPVGGVIVPVSKLELLAPWLGLVALMVVAVAAAVARLRRG
jgi:hypothetical protein